MSANVTQELSGLERAVGEGRMSSEEAEERKQKLLARIHKDEGESKEASQRRR